MGSSLLYQRGLTGIAALGIIIPLTIWTLQSAIAPLSTICVAACVIVLGILACKQAKPVAQSSETLETATLEARLGYRADLLELMTSSEPRSIILADKWQRILFANAEAARRAGRGSEELIGSTLAALVGNEHADVMKRHLQDAMRTGAPLIHVDDLPYSLSPRITQTSYIPVRDTKHIRDAVLITESDITSVVAERERREKMLRQLLDVCVAIVDKRDPHSAGHSAKVGEVARQLAVMLQLPGADIETAEVAGLLMNFGKVLVPQSILTKNSSLAADELTLVRKSMLSSADVLSIIQFDLPVVPTLRQLHEHFDGTGMPEGRKGTDIIITGRICLVANIFVALISDRAYRAGKPAAEAITILRQQAGMLYDPKIIDTLETLIKTPDWQERFQNLHASKSMAAR